MKIHLVSAYSAQGEASVSAWLEKCGCLASHHLVPSPADADLILFAEVYAGLDPYFLDVLRHPVYRAYRQKCVLYHISDVTQTLCRTISPSIDKNHPNAHARRSFSYLVRVHDNPYLDEIPVSQIFLAERRHLFSFVGDPKTHPVRQNLLALNHPRALLNAVTGSSATQMGLDEREPFQKGYLQTILDSEFVLCPRGIGPASMRLFEVMQLGRAPVIISDDWLPVSGIDWEEFALLVPEAQVGQIPQLLEQQKHRALEMGKRAREVWMENFSPQRALEGLFKRAFELVQIPITRREQTRDVLPLCALRHWRTLAACLRRRLQHGNCAGLPRAKGEKVPATKS